MNKYQEALDKINTEFWNYYGWEHCTKEINLLQQLVDKETPKKVNKEIIGYGKFADMPEIAIHKTTCPICDKELWYEKYKYCPDCGQALDKE